MVEVALVVLGWLLGIASTLIVAAIQKQDHMSDINGAILAELDELRYRLAWSSFTFAARAQEADRAQFELLASAERNYKGPLRNARIAEALTNLERLSDADLAELTAGLSPQEKAMGLKYLSTPAVHANISSLGGFPEMFQRLVFDVVRTCESINKEVDQSDYFFKLSFDTSQDSTNRIIARANLEAAYSLIDKLSRGVIDSIEKLEGYRGYSFGRAIWLRKIGWRREPGS